MRCRYHLRSSEEPDDEWRGVLAQQVTHLSTQTSRSHEDIFLLHAMEFLTDEKFKEDGSEVPMGLFHAIVQKAFGAKHFSKGMDPNMRTRLTDALVNVHLISPKANRMLSEVIKHVGPSESTIVREQAKCAKLPTVSCDHLVTPTKDGLFNMLDGQIEESTKILTVSMDEIVLARGLGSIPSTTAHKGSWLGPTS